MSQKKHPNPPEILHCEVTAKSRLFTVESLKLLFSNGEQRQYERIKGGGRGAVMIVPITADNELLLVREYCAGTNNYQLGFPKGLIDPGETPIEAGNRELKEEVGFGAEQFCDLKTLSLAPSYFNARMHILVAKGLYPEQLEGDEPEPLVTVKWPLAQWELLLTQNDFTEARSVAALLLLQQYLTQEV
ncbi:ADP compounds hydrolase NudE [Pseudoalteromonas holothuriae]|uniref:ADP compounds hydrolase NudE n=1 Tax=Pseudoalteromonas holothuriae TaxID=2963714 RepID=A0A9W4R2Z3_9GAMM|nr:MULTISPECIES: ADP compounds hydrolase NudE [unclassified Pseudoalteromonas]CAH9064546.1 ADP compounds hydrolase NudE [Pseudoalteromonas sp. CIP111854]CAH9065520.1 ADP compounds hydrolase NudE [Pseudoalteromonas sp. CIP111951]